MPTDEEIIRLLMQHDEQGLKLLRDTYGQRCYALANRIVGRHEDAEECVSDVMLTVWNSIPPLHPAHLPAYLVTLTQRRAINLLKMQKRQKRGGACFAQALDELAEVLPAGDSVEDAVEQRELNRRVNVFLDGLPADARRIFMQRYYLSLPVLEIARQNGMTVSAVKMSLMRTRNKLKDCLKEG